MAKLAPLGSMAEIKTATTEHLFTFQKPKTKKAFNATNKLVKQFANVAAPIFMLTRKETSTYSIATSNRHFRDRFVISFISFPQTMALRFLLPKKSATTTGLSGVVRTPVRACVAISKNLESYGTRPEVLPDSTIPRQNSRPLIFNHDN